MIDADDYQEPPMCQSTDEALAMLKRSRANMLLSAIGVLEGVADRRQMEAGLEVLHSALADLDAWERSMHAMLERDLQISRGDALRQH